MDRLGGIQHCIKCFGEWVFDRNVTFDIPINFKALEESCTEQDKQWVGND